jgi:apolipoprotein D and lipocalin family protein
VIKERWLPALCLLGALAVLPGCAIGPKTPTVTVHPKVDLERFMGDWYVIANIPTALEKGAHDAVESYALEPDGTVATTFSFRKDAFDGPPKVYRPRGRVRPGTNGAVWDMKFFGLVSSEYVISWVDDAYSETIIGLSSRDYVWIMARTPQIDEARYQALVEKVRADGYDLAKLQRVPQRPAPRDPRANVGK